LPTGRKPNFSCGPMGGRRRWRWLDKAMWFRAL